MDGQPLPPRVTARILREFERWQQVDAQVRALSKEQRRAVRDDGEPQVELVRRLLGLKGIGQVGAWILAAVDRGRRCLAVERRRHGPTVHHPAFRHAGMPWVCASGSMGYVQLDAAARCSWLGDCHHSPGP